VTRKRLTRAAWCSCLRSGCCRRTWRASDPS